jgi:ABC-2 type transport system permease protein
MSAILCAYAAAWGARFRASLQYRAAAMAGLITQLFWGLMRVMILAAFYESSTGQQPLSLDQVISYVWLGQALLLMQPWYIDREILEEVASGQVVYQLLRPLDIHTHWVCRDMANRLSGVVLRAVPELAIAGLFFGLGPPHSLAAAGAFAATALLALVLSSTLAAAVAVLTMWTVSALGVRQIVGAVAMVLSGMVVPLAFFPEWSQPIVESLPFALMMDTPGRFYTGALPLSALPIALLRGAVWLVILTLLGRWLLSRAKRRLVIQGG